MKRGTECPIFKVKVVGITRNNKDELTAVPRKSAKLLCLTSVISGGCVAHKPPQNISAMIENFLRFHLARKSITLLFFTNNVVTRST